MNLYERNQKQRDFFNEKIDSYDQVHETYMKTKRVLAESLDNNSKKILDLGAGTGLELIHLFELYPNASVVVVDISENMLNELSRREFANHVTTICGDFFEVDFGNEYDAVISTSALHHFKPDEKITLYKKILDCLRDDGLFINCDKISLNQEVQDHNLYELEHNFENYKHLDIPLTVKNEMSILEEIGFVDISSNEVDKEDYSLIIARKKSSKKGKTK